MKINKKGVSTGMIKGFIVGLIMLTVFLSIAPNLIHTSAVSVTALSTELSNSTLYGSGAAAIGGQIDDWTGYFWVVGPLILLITVILGVFLRGRR